MAYIWGQRVLVSGVEHTYLKPGSVAGTHIVTTSYRAGYTPLTVADAAVSPIPAEETFDMVINGVLRKGLIERSYVVDTSPSGAFTFTATEFSKTYILEAIAPTINEVMEETFVQYNGNVNAGQIAGTLYQHSGGSIVAVASGKVVVKVIGDLI